MIKNQEFSSKVSTPFWQFVQNISPFTKAFGPWHIYLQMFYQVPLLHLEAFPIVEVNVCNAQAALVAKTEDGGVLESPAEFNQSFQYTAGLKLIVHLSGVLQKANQLHAKNIAKLYQGPETNIAPENGCLEY